MALTDKLTAIGSAIRDKTGSTDLLTLDAMPTAISNIQTGSGGVPDKLLSITGDSSYLFKSPAWNWVIEDYGNQITTKDITKADYMFSNTSLTGTIPFDINIKDGSNAYVDEMFSNSKVETIPYIKGSVCYFQRFLYGNSNIREIPEDIADYMNFDYMHNLTSGALCYNSYVFAYCYSLRRIPESFLKELWTSNTGYNYSTYNYGFNTCYALDEIRSLPVYNSTYYTGNLFAYGFNNCSRVKAITFDMQDDGTPYVVQWKSQTIDLSNYVGYVSNSSSILNYNSGITSDKHVENDATYQALKDDPDWYSIYIAYSRYNHDSAVETINSLPDTSAYLASAGGTNTIKFKGASGSSTDGGAINTLTEEEIAVATAKGWTVTLV